GGGGGWGVGGDVDEFGGWGTGGVEEVLEVPPVQRQHFDVATRPHIGGAPCFFEDSYLAENFPAVERSQGHVRALRRMSHHVHLAVGDDVEPVRLISLPDHYIPRLESHCLQTVGGAGQSCLTQPWKCLSDPLIVRREGRLPRLPCYRAQLSRAQGLEHAQDLLNVPTHFQIVHGDMAHDALGVDNECSSQARAVIQ